ncbi:MAG: hypothetical protein JXA37_13585 [Chloroflexia bacterium]|nr:hypothetical protein [Chloroflexia bacterium]
MGESTCPQCGATGTTASYTVDRYGVCHWFRECHRCGHRWEIRYCLPAYDNPHLLGNMASWRPETIPEYRDR